MANYTLVAEPGKQEIVVTSLLDAPRELVYRAMTQAEHIPHWWGPAYLTTIVDKFDARQGGEWRIVQRDDQGNDYAFRGVYHDLVAPERVTYTFEFEGIPGHVLLETITLVDKGGKTEMIDHSVFQSVADRDGMLHSGMEGGAAESIDRLQALLSRLATS